jgi:DNA-binding XRE family transcriptional regulator
LNTTEKPRRRWYPPVNCPVHCGGVLASARVMARMTQAEMGKAAGLSDRAIRYWERRADPPSCWSTMARIKKALATKGVGFSIQASAVGPFRWHC